MQKKVTLPPLEAGFDTTMVLEWLVAVGDRVEAEQPLLEIETQKSVSEVPSPDGGYVRRLFVESNDNIGEGALLCILTDTADEPFGDAAEIAVESAPENALPEPPQEQTDSPVAAGGIKALPAVRKLAREMGVELSGIHGTGSGGQITLDDVRNSGGQHGSLAQTVSAQSSPVNAGLASGDWTPLPAYRVALNRQMQQSLAEIPQIHVARQMDVTPLTVKTEGITFTHRLVQKLAAALEKHPALRTMINGERIRTEPVSVAVAIESSKGLTAPVIRDTNTLQLAQIAQRVTEFRARSESGSLTKEELANGPFALTNLGMFGVDFFNAFVFYGQTAVLAVGRAAEAPAGRKVAWFSLAVDHRVVDGAEAARFLATLQELISNA